MTDLSFMYKCEQCNRNFATPARLKNHQNLCRDRHSADDVDPRLSQLASKDPADRSGKPGPPASDWVPEQTDDE